MQKGYRTHKGPTGDQRSTHPVPKEEHRTHRRPAGPIGDGPTLPSPSSPHRKAAMGLGITITKVPACHYINITPLPFVSTSPNAW